MLCFLARGIFEEEGFDGISGRVCMSICSSIDLGWGGGWREG